MIDRLRKVISLFFLYFSVRRHDDEDFTGLPNEGGMIRWVIKGMSSGKSRLQIYRVAQVWLAENFKREDYTVLVDDQGSCILFGELILRNTSRAQIKLSYTVMCENEKFTLILDNLETHRGRNADPTKQDNDWVSLQENYDNYLKRKQAGWYVGDLERNYRMLKDDIHRQIIDTFVHIITGESTV